MDKDKNVGLPFKLVTRKVVLFNRQLIFSTRCFEMFLDT